MTLSYLSTRKERDDKQQESGSERGAKSKEAKENEE
jgi:hypothetical protein